MLYNHHVFLWVRKVSQFFGTCQKCVKILVDSLVQYSVSEYVFSSNIFGIYQGVSQKKLAEGPKTFCTLIRRLRVGGL